MPTPLTIPLRVGTDLAGVAVGYDGARLQFVVPKAFPPGQPLQLTLLPTDEPALLLAARSVGSKRRSDGAFDVQARLVSLDRAARERLAQLFAQA
jgi:hypothetical protein